MLMRVHFLETLKTYLGRKHGVKGSTSDSLSALVLCVHEALVLCVHESPWSQLADLLNEVKEGMQCMLVKFFAHKAVWLKTSCAKQPG